MPFIKKNYEVNWKNSIRKISDRSMADKYFSNRFKKLIEKELFYLSRYVSDGDKILDIGSETGRIGFFITDILNIKPSELFLTDYDEEYIKVIESNIKHNENYIQVLKEDVTEFSNLIKDNYFDVITVYGDVFNLIKTKNPISIESDIVSKSIKNCICKLKPNGKILFTLNLDIVNDWNENNIKSILEKNFKLELLDNSKIFLEGNHNYRHIYCCRKITL
tara:strand:- start:3236 stop:3895 length:660 start_codon:yes stop_codon:yes gene_type:complete